MKLKTAILLVLPLSAVLVHAQWTADWIDLEISAKQRLLEKRWEISKTIASGNRNDYDVGYYGLDIKIDIADSTISGTTTIRGKSLAHDLTYIDLDFFNNMEVLNVSEDAHSFSHSNNVLRLYLNNSGDVGEIFKVVIQYEGTPQQGGFMAFSFDEHEGLPVVSTLSEPYFARAWFPCKDTPEDKADSADITITVPDTLVAVSNGLLKKVVDNEDGTVTYFWQERYPIANYLISLAISNYVYREDTYTALDSTEMPVGYWLYPESVESAQSNLALTSEMIAYFARLWGEYPFIKEKYGQAQFNWGGGMEHQTCTSLGSFGEMLICHELAHQWWGDMVTCANWHNIWLNEGFARYSEALWREHKDGMDGLCSYMAGLNRPEYWQSGSVYIVDTTRVGSIFNRIVYDKGAWVLHMLRKVLGEDLFRAVFSAYRDEYYMDVAVTEDFKNVCEEVAGFNLDWFFDQWVFGEGQPHYQVVWSRSQINKSLWSLNVSISQIQITSTVFSMPIDLFVETADYDTVFTIWDSLSVQEFSLECRSKPISLTLDPEGWVLKNVTYKTIDPDLPYIPDDFLLSEPYPNPFNGLTFFKVYLPYDIEGDINVYDIMGREVDSIESGKLREGYYTKKWEPLNQSSGVYIIRLRSDRISRQQKVLYIK